MELRYFLLFTPYALRLTPYALRLTPYQFYHIPDCPVEADEYGAGYDAVSYAQFVYFRDHGDLANVVIVEAMSRIDPEPELLSE